MTICRHNRHIRNENVQSLKDQALNGQHGVSRAMFDKMLTVVKRDLRDFGRPPTLSREDQLLITLMYWREYLSEFHIALTYVVSGVNRLPYDQKG